MYLHGEGGDGGDGGVSDGGGGGVAAEGIAAAEAAAGGGYDAEHRAWMRRWASWMSSTHSGAARPSAAPGSARAARRRAARMRLRAAHARAPSAASTPQLRALRDGATPAAAGACGPPVSESGGEAAAAGEGAALLGAASGRRGGSGVSCTAWWRRGRRRRRRSRVSARAGEVGAVGRSHPPAAGLRSVPPRRRRRLGHRPCRAACRGAARSRVVRAGAGHCACVGAVRAARPTRERRRSALGQAGSCSAAARRVMRYCSVMNGTRYPSLLVVFVTAAMSHVHAAETAKI